MAQTIQQDDLDNNRSIDQQQTQQPGQAGSRVAPVGGIQAQQQPQKQSTIQTYNPNQQRGSGYTNIQRIVQANSGNKLGQTIGGGIQQAGQQTQQQLGQAQQQFQQQTGQNAFDTEQNKQLVQQVLQDPTKYAQTGSNNPESQAGSQFQKLISGQYQGPMALQGAEQLQSRAADVGQLGQALGSTGGRQGLLQRFVGNPQYQAGQQKLDTLLLGQTSGPQLAAAKRAALGLQAQATGAIGGAQQMGQEQINKARGFGQGVQQQFGDVVTGREQELSKQATEAQTARDAQLSNIRQKLSTGELSKELADQLGVGGGGQLTYGVDPTKFLQASTVKASEQNIASPEDYARFQALQKLAGGNVPQQAQDVFGKFSGQQEHAGEFAKAPAYTIDKPGFQKAYQAAQDQYRQAIAPVEGHLQQLQQINSMVQQRDSHPPGSPEFNAIQSQITQQFPGAAAGGFTRSDWARGELDRVQKQYNDTLGGLQQAYGTGTFKIS